MSRSSFSAIVRNFFIARAFGAGAATDAFFVAFRLPNLLRRMFAEGAFSQAFVPILGEYRNRRGNDDARALDPRRFPQPNRSEPGARNPA
mgnify:CR=1 FL=1